MKDKKYIVEMSEEQLKQISFAAELVARLGLGQLSMALDATPIDYSKTKYSRNYIEKCDKIMRECWSDEIKRPYSSYSIVNKNINQKYKILYDIHQVIDYTLYKEKEIKNETLLDKMKNEASPPFKEAEEDLMLITKKE